MINEERKPWEQIIEQNEPDLWYGRFVKFMRLGTKRSVNAVFKKEPPKRSVKPRMVADNDWYEIAKQWNWAERARAYDEYQRVEEDRIIEEERNKVLRSGFALQHKRIKELDRLARKLIRYTNDEEKIWIPETKKTTTTQGKDKSQEQVVEKIVFNAPLFTLIDKYQDSLAKEMGERVKREQVDVTNMNDKDMQSLHDAIERALEQFPEAKQALAQELAELNNE
jgi:hypothetical protein